MWRHVVSHSQVLLRSVRTDLLPTRIEILFKSVDFVCLPTRMPGLSVSEGSGDESVPGMIDSSLVSRGSIRFEVRGPQYEGFVIAGSITVAEDDKGYAEGSSLWPVGD